jgi:dTDP-4-dehydrorhamnose reductase
MPKKHKVLIIGSSGMLGVDLCEELRKNYVVIGADLVTSHKSVRSEAEPPRRGHVTRFIKCDVTDEDGVIKVISKLSPDIVIHTAAWTDVDACELGKDKAYRINSEGTENVALACKKAGATLIYISTDFVFDGRKRSAYKETDRPNPVSIYGDSKFIGENAVNRILTKYYILRTGWLYGANGKNFVDTILAKAETEKELKVVDDQVGSPTYTKDFARAIHKLIDMADSRWPIVDGCGIYHVTNSGSVSWFEYAKEILKLAGLKTRVIPISSGKLGRPAKRPAMSVLNNSKFTKFTGYKMRNWKQALKEYIVRKG